MFLRAAVLRGAQLVLASPSVVLAAQRLFTSAWVAASQLPGASAAGGSGGSSVTAALIDAIGGELRRFASGTAPHLSRAVSHELRGATVRLYLRALLGGRDKLPAAAADACALDARAFGAWCAEPLVRGDSGVVDSQLLDLTEPTNGGGAATGATAGGAADATAARKVASAELSALGCVRLLLTSGAAGFADAYARTLSQHPDAPLALAETLLTRRPELSKERKALLTACSQLKQRAAGSSAIDGVFSRALTEGAAAGGGGRAGGSAAMRR